MPLQSILIYVIGFGVIGGAQWLVYSIYRKSGKWLLALLPNLMVPIFGVFLTLFLYWMGVSEGNTWIDLGVIILVILTFYATLISVGISIVMLVILSLKKKKQT